MSGVIINNLDLWTSALLTKSTAGRGSNGKQKAYGIKKLRELILELAVRGKLVPQDPNDEPASVLLEQIEKEKARLLKEEKIRKQEKQPAITNNEKPFDIPEDWDWIRLGDAVEIVRGITFPASEKARLLQEGRIACLRTTNVQDQVEWDDMLYIREEFVNRAEQFIRANDIVMSTANSRELVGKVAIVNHEPKQRTAFGGFLSVLRPILLDPYFVMILLRTPVNRNALIDSASQTTNIANISIGKLNPLILAVPPLAEQHRIVAKVDELMALCDQLEQQQADGIEAHQTLVETLLGPLISVESQTELSEAWLRIANHFDTLFTTEHSIGRLKQTILRLAVTGKLVPQDPKDEPASELLNHIQAEKTRLAMAGQIKKDKTAWVGLPEEPPNELPLNWEWTRLQDMFEISRGGSPRPAGDPRYFGGAIPWITVGEITKDSEKYLTSTEGGLTEEGAARSRFIDPGDLLLTNSGATLGVPKISRIRACLNDGVAVLRSFHSVPLNDFAYLYLQSQTPIFRQVNQGMGQPNLNTPIIAGWFLPVPPLAEQHRIVAKVDELMALCDVLQAHIAVTQLIQVHLANAIVEQSVA